jgi:Mrp family chromosome partitioning ATPase
MSALASASLGGPAFLDGVIEKLLHLREEHGPAMFAFVAPHWRAGTTHITNLVAEELALRHRCSVAVMPKTALQEAHPSQLSQNFLERSPGVYVAASQTDLQQMSDAALEKVWIRPSMNDFDFLLVDCPALLKDPQALRWTHAAKAVFLVVAAGVTHVNQIEESQRLLKISASRLEGIILNRRSYPIPELLYKLI